MTFLLEQIAQPRLSSRRLEVLATHDDPSVRATVAANPSTPPAALLSLLAEFPAAVLGNPALVLHQIADPGLFGRADATMQTAWARHPDMPAWLLLELSRSEVSWVRDAVAANPNTPLDVVAQLGLPHELGDEDSTPCTSAMQHPGLPQGLAFDLAMYFVDSIDPEFEDPAPAEMHEMLLLDPSEAAALAGDDEPLGARWATRLPVDEDNNVDDEEGWAGLIWKRPEGPYTQMCVDDDLCTGGIESDDEDEDGEAIEGEATPGAFFDGSDEATIWGMTPDELASHRDAPWWLVRRRCHRSDSAHEQAMVRPDVPADELSRLATSRSPQVRRAVASHRSTPARVLATLALSDEPMIRLRVAQHPCAPADALTVLASDASATIRRAVAANEATPGEVRERLMHDRWTSVRRAAAGLGHDEEEAGDEDDEDAYGDA